MLWAFEINSLHGYVLMLGVGERGAVYEVDSVYGGTLLG